MKWDTALGEFPGVGEVRARALERLGLRTAGDLLRYFPRDYEDRTRTCTIAGAAEGESVCIPAVVAETPRVSHIRKGLDLTKVKVVDDHAAMTVTFFNQSYVKDALRPGESYIFSGQLEGLGRARQMTNPVFERENAARFTGRIMPVYPLTHGVSNNLLAGLTERALKGCLEQVEETLPQGLRQEHALAALAFSYQNIHFPRSFEDLELARRRFTFEELFYLSCGLALLKSRRSEGSAPVCAAGDRAEFEALLPFAPTSAQRRAMGELAADLASGRPMNRLLQGDVGSGKTAVAAFGAWLAWKSGFQCALMAPTEILASQHMATLSSLLSPAGVRTALLTGSMKAAEKRKVCAALDAGEIDLVVGTHALLSEGVAFRRLGLVITDEQHRFGVEQRAALGAKATLGTPPPAGRRECGEGRGNSLPPAANKMTQGDPGGTARPHVLVMSATPIPRTLALIIYGDLDVSVIDQLPPGRLPVKTVLVGESKRQRMYGFVREQIRQGRQAYIVCPAIETDPESAATDLKRVVEYAEGLQKQVFPDLRVGLVHGRMKAKDKDAAMAAFARGGTQILVSTTVVEVGVDVANPTLMIGENADRYGLSQLHQLRGRVGRGEHQSWCVLVSDNRSPETRARLKVLVDTADGFRIAEEDLKLRGPGDFFGRRQHGLPALRMADLNTDTRVLKEARDAAAALLSADPDLSRPEHRPLLEKVRRLFQENPDMFN